MSTPPRGLDLALLAALALLWGVNWPLMKIGLHEFGPMTFRMATGIFGGAGLLLVALAMGERMALPRGQWLPLLLAALLNYSIWQVLGGYGIIHMDSGVASMLAFTMPLWAVVLAAIFLGDPITRRRLAVLLFGLGGLGVLFSGSLDAIGAEPMGIPLMLGAALSWAAGTVYLKSVPWRVSVVALTTWLILVGQLPVIAVTLAVEGAHWPAVSAEAWAALAYNVGPCFVFGYIAWFRILRAFPAPVAAISTLMIPCIGVASGAVLLGEQPGWRVIAALVMVMTAIAIVLEARLPGSRERSKS
jgi:drug/metabolite transporter (DMT)-like permease